MELNRTQRLWRWLRPWLYRFCELRAARYHYPRQP